MPHNPKSNSNLRPQKKGEPSHNPNGRNGSEEKRLTTLLRKEIKRIAPLTQGGKPCTKTWEELIVEATMRLAIKGNPKALQTVWERLEGRMPLPVTGGDGEPLFPSVSEKTDGELDTLIAQLEARKGIVAKVKSGGNEKK